MQVFFVIGIVLILVVALWMFWRTRSGRRPCPPSLIFLLNNPFTKQYHRDILSRLELAPGLRVLDAGCGPGLLTVPVGKVKSLAAQAGFTVRNQFGNFFMFTLNLEKPK